MVVSDIAVADLVPYANNPRMNLDAVDAVANSIREFGFKVPLVVDRNKVVVCGHTRLLAAQKLGILAVPCIVADDLNDEQIRAFRIADNSVAALAEWDMDKLGIELEAIPDIDMEQFGIPEMDEEPEKREVDLLSDDGERDVAGMSAVAELVDWIDWEDVNYWGVPRLKDFFPTYDGEKDKQLFIGRDGPQDGNVIYIYGTYSVHKTNLTHSTVAFYTEDSRFECLFTNPSVPVKTMINVGIETCLGVDYSTYFNDAKIRRLYSMYKSFCVNRYFQEAGLRVIPSVIGAIEDFDIVRDCVPRGAPLAVQIHRKYTNSELDHKRKLIKAWIDAFDPAFMWVYYSNANKPHFEDLFEGRKSVWTESFISQRQKVITKG